MIFNAVLQKTQISFILQQKTYFNRIANYSLNFFFYSENEYINDWNIIIDRTDFYK